MKNAIVPKIRPVAWRIFVQGEVEAEYVRGLLHDMNIHTNMPSREPGLMEPALWSFVATSAEGTVLTIEELEAILKADEKVTLAFENAY